MTQDLYAQLSCEVKNAITALQAEGYFPEELDTKNVLVEQPNDPTHGDFATNAALVLSKQARKNPREIGEKLASLLNEAKAINKTDVAGPGFVNITVDSDAFQDQIETIIEQGADYGKTINHKAEKVLVEFVSINPTGPIHVGHGRNAVVGDTICNLLGKYGDTVYREYLINDAGAQIDKIVLSVHARYLELFGQQLNLPEDGYIGEYVIDIAQELKDKDGDKWLNRTEENELVKELREFCVDSCMHYIKADMEAMDIHFDNFHSEYAMHKAGDPLSDAIKILREKDFVYEGKLEAPKGKDIKDYVPVDLTLFRSTKFGAEQDKPIYNRRGIATYFGQDIAYHKDKLGRAGGQDKLITVIGADQQGNFTPLIWALESVTGRKNTLTPFYYAMVKTLRNGEPVKLSKRAGNIIALKDVLNEVGKDAYRFHMLTRKSETELVFDLAKAAEKNNENPVFYVQYAHARMAAVFRQQKELNIPENDQTNLSLLTHPTEVELMKALCHYPMMIERAASSLEPHRLAFYAQDLAAKFHSWYNAEKFLIPEDLPLTHARLHLVKAAKIVLKDVLSLMGVSAPEQM